MIRHNFIEYQGARLHYAKTGNGEKTMLVFHGFGQDLSTFDHFTHRLAPHYSFYIFDLYFHGLSTWNQGEKPLSKAVWRATMERFLTTTGIETFSIAAFSMGGKFALATVEAFPEKTKELILIAPDGIKTNIWYNMATYPLPLRNFFKTLVLRPDRFEKVAGWLHRSGFIDSGLLRFADYQMSSVEKRDRVYYSWVVFRHLTFNTGRIAALMNEYHIRLLVIVGEYDRVIPPANVEPFVRKVKGARMEVLQSGHHGLINQSLPFIMHD